MKPAGTGPSARSGVQMSSFGGGVLVVGGFSKIKAKKDSDKGTVSPSRPKTTFRLFILAVLPRAVLDRWPDYP